MTRHAPRTRRGAHRTRRDLVAAAVPSLLAVAAVGALVTALYVWRGEDVERPAVAVSRTPELTASREPASVSPSPKPPSTSAPATTAPATNAPATKTATSAPASSRPAQPRTTELEVVVLNQTTRRGLAASVAQQLEKRGFDVAGTGNFQGVVPATTVYFPPGGQADALVVAKALPTEPRLRPRFGNLSTSGLTIVLTSSYPS